MCGCGAPWLGLHALQAAGTAAYLRGFMVWGPGCFGCQQPSSWYGAADADSTCCTAQPDAHWAMQLLLPLSCLHHPWPRSDAGTPPPALGADSTWPRPHLHGLVWLCLCPALPRLAQPCMAEVWPSMRFMHAGGGRGGGGGVWPPMHPESQPPTMRRTTRASRSWRTCATCSGCPSCSSCARLAGRQARCDAPLLGCLHPGTCPSVSCMRCTCRLQALEGCAGARQLLRCRCACRLQSTPESAPAHANCSTCTLACRLGRACTCQPVAVSAALRRVAPRRCRTGSTRALLQHGAAQRRRAPLLHGWLPNAGATSLPGSPAWLFRRLCRPPGSGRLLLSQVLPRQAHRCWGLTAWRPASLRHPGLLLSARGAQLSPHRSVCPRLLCTADTSGACAGTTV